MFGVGGRDCRKISRTAYFAAILGFGGGWFFEFFVWWCMFACR